MSANIHEYTRVAIENVVAGDLIVLEYPLDSPDYVIEHGKAALRQVTEEVRCGLHPVAMMLPTGWSLRVLRGRDALLAQMQPSEAIGLKVADDQIDVAPAEHENVAGGAR